MLVMTGSRERTAHELTALYRASGFELTRIVSARSDFRNRRTSGMNPSCAEAISC
jgi:hypothetical protein